MIMKKTYKYQIGDKHLGNMFSNVRELGVLIALLLLVLAFSLASPVFFTVNNLLNIIRQVSLTGIIAMGMTMVIVSGEIDLSVGSVYGFGAIISGLLMTTAGLPIWLAIIIGLLTGAGFGLVNGFLVTYGRIPALIVTLGMLSIARGATLLISKAAVVSTNARTVKDSALPVFLFLGQGKVFDIVPMMTIFFALIAITAYIVYSKTPVGFYMKAVGGNAAAARAAGINVNVIKIIGFTITGLFCALAGILNLSFLANVQGTVGYGLELEVIAAVIIGGTSLTGGEGTILGTVIGVLIMGVLRNGLVLLGVSPYLQVLIIGIVIIISVAIDMWSRSKTS